MTFTCSIPLLRAAFWSEAEPPTRPTLPWLDRAWGSPDVAFVEPLARRRLGRLARSAFHVAARVVPPQGCRLVFASQHGDGDRAAAMMTDVAQGLDLSPTAFAVSVHNAVPGQWSLLRQDRSPSSALAAGPDTLALGLVEAWLAWRRSPETPVLCVYAEDRLPELFRGFSAHDPEPCAAAFLLSREARTTLGLAREEAPRDPDPRTSLAEAALEALAVGHNLTWTGAQGTWTLQVESP